MFLAIKKRVSFYRVTTNRSVISKNNSKSSDVLQANKTNACLSSKWTKHLHTTASQSNANNTPQS